MDYFGGNAPQNPMYGGVQMQPQGMYRQPIVKRKPLLSAEKINALRSNVANFSLGLTQDEVDRSACNHFDENGELMLREVANKPNVYQCIICGWEMMPKEGLTAEELHDCVGAIEDVLQTIKLMYVDAPVQALSDFMSVIALLKKVPQLYKIAADNQAKYDGAGVSNYNGNLNAFSVFNNILSGAIAPPMMQQPVYQQAYQQPIMNTPTPQQQAMLNPNGAYMPNTTDYRYTPGQQTATMNAEAENERLRRELEEAKAKLAAQGGENVTVTTKMES